MESNQAIKERLVQVIGKCKEEALYFEAKVDDAQRNVGPPTPDEIKQLIDTLFDMKHFGQVIEKAITVVQAEETKRVLAKEISIVNYKPNVISPLNSIPPPLPPFR